MKSRTIVPAVLVMLAAVASVIAPAASALAPTDVSTTSVTTTVVSLTFDDTHANQVLASRLLDARGFKGTFYVNSPRLASSSSYITLAQQLGSPDRVDLLSRLSGVDTEKVWKTRVKGAYQGLPACFISRECLLKNKRAADRGQDRLDVQKLDKQARLARRKKGRIRKV